MFAVEDAITVSHSAVLEWLEKEAAKRGEDASDLDQTSFGGETISEEIAALICIADSDGLFVGPPDLPRIGVNAYALDFDTVLVGLRPYEGSVSLHSFAYGQIASYTIDAYGLAVGESGTERILSVLDVVAAEVNKLIYLYRVVLGAERESKSGNS